jgi:hypothetical protein
MIQQSHLLVFTHELENLGRHKKMHMNVYSSFTHNFQNLKATNMTFVRQIDVETAGHGG